MSVDREAIVAKAMTAIEAKGAGKEASDKAQAELLDLLVSSCPCPDHCMSGLRDTHDVSISETGLSIICDGDLPAVVVGALIVQHAVAFNRKLRPWQRFQRRYLMGF